jgi:mannose-6-phosphate isomerase-like protein (cupin superfamily)
MRSVSGKIPTSKDTVIFAKPFNHSSFSAGVVVIQPGGEKSSSVVQKSTLVFVVESGYLVVQIHHASFYAKEGTLFLVPVGKLCVFANSKGHETGTSRRVLLAMGNCRDSLQ